MLLKKLQKKHEEIGRDFSSIYDLCSNIDTRVVNKRVLEGLVLAGSFDKLKGNRAQNFDAIENALSFGNKVQSSQSSDMDSLFGENDDAMKIEEPELPEIEAWSTRERLAKERIVLGFYLSDHPLRKFSTDYYSFSTVHLGEPETFAGSESVRAVGVITEVRTKNG